MDDYMIGKLCVAVIEDVAEKIPPDLDINFVPVSSETASEGYALTVLRSQHEGYPIETSASALFLLLPESASTDLEFLWHDRRVVGFGREADAATWEELQEVIAELKTNQQGRNAEQSQVSESPEGLSGVPFVSHFRGPMRPFYRDLRDLLSSLQPFPPTELPPFNKILPAQWLDLYGYYKLGAYLEGDQANLLLERLKKEKKLPKGQDQGSKAQEYIEAEFEKLFCREEVKAQPRKPILLTGETGTGKTLVAEMIHQYWTDGVEKDIKSPLTQINCAALGNLLESDLFGAMRGAFTDAQVTNPGAIIASYGGVLFLDEIGSMPLRAQARLLIYLDRGDVSPQGWRSTALAVPIQIVAATNEDLWEKVQSRKFRADLYYRFEQQLRIPALRERGETDIQLLIHNLLVKTDTTISRDAMGKLVKHDYPGNYRELQHLLRDAKTRANRISSTCICSTDIEFGKSTLPPQYSVIALIKKRFNGVDHFLLRFNPYWLQYFLIGGRFEAIYRTFENTLEEELDKKLHIKPEAYKYTFIREVKMIQHSDREQKLKHYTFYMYGIRLDHDPCPEQGPNDGLVWVSQKDIERGRLPNGEPISRSVLEIATRAELFDDCSRFPMSV